MISGNGVTGNEITGSGSGPPGATGGLPGVVLALQKTTHHTLHALSAALADLSLSLEATRAISASAVDALTSGRDDAGEIVDGCP